MLRILTNGCVNDAAFIVVNAVTLNIANKTAAFGSGLLLEAGAAPVVVGLGLGVALSDFQELCAVYRRCLS